VTVLTLTLALQVMKTTHSTTIKKGAHDTYLVITRTWIRMIRRNQVIFPTSSCGVLQRPLKAMSGTSKISSTYRMQVEAGDQITFLHGGKMRVGRIYNKARHQIIVEYDEMNRHGFVEKRYVLKTTRSVRGKL
jgi:hypothetical protein